MRAWGRLDRASLREELRTSPWLVPLLIDRLARCTVGEDADLADIQHACEGGSRGAIRAAGGRCRSRTRT